MKTIALASVVVVGFATNASARNLDDVLGTWVCTKKCGAAPAYAQQGLISERPDGTLIFYANVVPPGRYVDVAEGRWTGPDTIALNGLLGTAFAKVNWVRVGPGASWLRFEHGAEWTKQTSDF
jgi:hypothetical protein